jgi:hypothetical protein
MREEAGRHSELVGVLTHHVTHSSRRIGLADGVPKDRAVMANKPAPKQQKRFIFPFALGHRPVLSKQLLLDEDADRHSATASRAAECLSGVRCMKTTDLSRLFGSCSACGNEDDAIAQKDG